MPTRSLGFDDRWLVALGIPALGFLVPVLFYGASPAELGWAGFAPQWAVSALYTATYWLLSRVLIAFWRRRCPGREHTTRRVAKTVASLVLLVLVVEVSCRTVLSWGDLLVAADYEWSDYGLWRTAPVSLLLVLGMTAMYEAIYFFGLYRQAELDRERLLRAQVETQLDALRKQVDPHFLFNSLNTLATIIPEDPAAAVTFTERLAAVYRRLLAWRHAATVTVAEELDALRDYVHLLAVRYEGRLRVDVDVPQRLRARSIVPLALQTLVENAVKHNEASRARPLRVEVVAEGDELVVRNGLAPKPVRRGSESTGLGLDNLRDRVRYLGHGEVRVTREDDTFSVRVPLGAAREVETVVGEVGRGVGNLV